MKNQSNIYSKKYEFFDFDILLTSFGGDDNILKGSIKYFKCDHNNDRNLKKDIANISFYIFNTYDLNDMLLLADSISSYSEYIASAYYKYSDDFGAMGSIAIIDEFNLSQNISGTYDIIKTAVYFLAKTIEKLQILGTGILLFTLEAISFNFNNLEKITMLNNLLDIMVIPIYQDEFDVVLVRNREYTI